MTAPTATRTKRTRKARPPKGFEAGDRSPSIAPGQKPFAPDVAVAALAALSPAQLRALTLVNTGIVYRRTDATGRTLAWTSEGARLPTHEAPLARTIRILQERNLVRLCPGESTFYPGYRLVRPYSNATRALTTT